MFPGIKKRFLAYKRLLEDNPKYIEKVLFLQIAVPSRTDVKEYQDLKEEIDKLVGMINGKFSTSKWSPVRYIYGQINQVTKFAFTPQILSTPRSTSLVGNVGVEL